MGEFELLRRIRDRLPAPGPGIAVGSGDDAAVSERPGAAVTSVDLLVQDVHFRRETASPRQIGHKALATALSDIAAMGADAHEAYLAMTVPPDLGEEECMDILEGAAALAGDLGVTIAGGDLSAGAILTLGVTVVGSCEEAGQAVTRAGAGPGDAILITGEVGGAAAGLALLEGRARGAELDREAREVLVARQLTPTPRLAAGRALREAGATAMIDVSDGLGADAGHLAAASGVALDIALAELPLAAGVEPVAAELGIGAVDLAATGGEDYELLAALPAHRVGAATAALQDAGLPLHLIGEARVGSGVSLSSVEGRRGLSGGFDQLNPQP